VREQMQPRFIFTGFTLHKENFFRSRRVKIAQLAFRKIRFRRGLAVRSMDAIFRNYFAGNSIYSRYISALDKD
jgi:hypothetical protein